MINGLTDEEYRRRMYGEEPVTDRSTLATGEPHPAAHMAMEYLQSVPLDKLLMHLEAFASCAIEGNRLAEICDGTLNRFINHEPVSDRYLLGLVYAMRYGEDVK